MLKQQTNNYLLIAFSIDYSSSFIWILKKIAHGFTIPKIRTKQDICEDIIMFCFNNDPCLKFYMCLLHKYQR